jgi:hypothetical protein
VSGRSNHTYDGRFVSASRFDERQTLPLEDQTLSGMIGQERDGPGVARL